MDGKKMSMALVHIFNLRLSGMKMFLLIIFTVTCAKNLTTDHNIVKEQHIKSRAFN